MTRTVYREMPTALKRFEMGEERRCHRSCIVYDDRDSVEVNSSEFGRRSGTCQILANNHCAGDHRKLCSCFPRLTPIPVVDGNILRFNSLVRSIH